MPLLTERHPMVTDASGFGHQMTSSETMKYFPRNIYTSGTPVTTSGVTEENKINFTVPAGQLSADGAAIHFDIHGWYAANTNRKRIILYFGSQQFLDLDTTTNDGSFHIFGHIRRRSNTEVTCYINSFTTPSGSYKLERLDIDSLNLTTTPYDLDVNLRSYTASAGLTMDSVTFQYHPAA